MKKYLALLCALMTFTTFGSCGNTKDTSTVMNSISETTSETEATTEFTIEQETKEINPLLDKKITCNYLSLYIPSEWDYSIDEYDDCTIIWLDYETDDSIMFSICDNSDENSLYDQYSNYKISKTFTSYGQEYSIIEGANEDRKKLIFSNDRVNGVMAYSVDYEDIVIDMVKSIEFNDNISKNSVELDVELDSDWECDYLKIGTCSEWKENSNINGNSFTASWDWNDSGMYHFISLRLDESSMGKMSQSDLQEFYEEYFKYYSNENNYEIIDNFMRNNQAYIVIGNEELSFWNIHFSTDTVQGDFTYTKQDEEIVRKMIETIEFY